MKRYYTVSYSTNMGSRGAVNYLPVDLVHETVKEISANILGTFETNKRISVVPPDHRLGYTIEVSSYDR